MLSEINENGLSVNIENGGQISVINENLNINLNGIDENFENKTYLINFYLKYLRTIEN